MSIDTFMLIAVGVMVACGVFLMLERALTRILLGFLLIGNALNILLLTVSGHSGAPSFYGDFSWRKPTDPLAQALTLTSIVISMATAAFVIALAYRSFMISDSDDIIPAEELVEKDQPGAAEELIDMHDHYSPMEDPAVDRAYAEDNDPTGDLFEPLSLDDDDDAIKNNTHGSNVGTGSKLANNTAHDRQEHASDGSSSLPSQESTPTFSPQHNRGEST